MLYLKKYLVTILYHINDDEISFTVYSHSNLYHVVYLFLSIKFLVKNY